MLKTYSRKIYDWAVRKAHSDRGWLWIFLVFVLEIFFILPLDALLVLFCAHNSSKRFLFSLSAAVASVVSGVIGFGIGFLLWDYLGGFLLKYVISEKTFTSITASFLHYEFIAVSLSALLPIPFKVIAVSAGFSKLHFGCFMLSVFLARMLRFYAIAWATGRFGQSVRNFFDRYCEKIAVLSGIKVAVGVFLLWALSKP